MDPGPPATSDFVEAVRRIEAARESDVVEQALTAARERLGMDAAYVSRIDSEHQTIDALSGQTAAAALLDDDGKLPLSETYCARMLSGEIPNIVPDTHAEPAVKDLTATRYIGSYVGVPVKLADGRLHGTLCCVAEGPRPGLGEEELRFMTVLAGIVAARVDEARGDMSRLVKRATA